MKLYIAWWTYHDPYDGGEGILGVFDNVDLAAKCAEDYVSRDGVEIEDRAVVTEVTVNDTSQTIWCYDPIMSFNPSDEDLKEDRGDDEAFWDVDYD